jgi:hypothetical protein
VNLYLDLTTGNELVKSKEIEMRCAAIAPGLGRAIDEEKEMITAPKMRGVTLKV